MIKPLELLETYEIWEKVSNSIKIEFDSVPAYYEKYIKANTKPHDGKIKTSFHNYKIPKEGSQSICLSVILIYSVYRTGLQNSL